MNTIHATAPQIYPNILHTNLEPTSRYENNYMLTAIINGKKTLENEEISRDKTLHKYKRATKFIFGFECFFALSEMSLTAVSLTVPPLAIVSTPACLGLTTCSILLRSITKIIDKKIQKHEKILATARSKINSINDKYYVAIKDGVITQTEFDNILAEVENYKIMKDHIRKTPIQIKPEISEELKQAYKEEGKNSALTIIKEKLDNV